MQHMGTKLLQTDRLILRPFTMADAQAMYDNWASDPAVTEQIGRASCRERVFITV